MGVAPPKLFGAACPAAAAVHWPEPEEPCQASWQCAVVAPAKCLLLVCLEAPCWVLLTKVTHRALLAPAAGLAVQQAARAREQLRAAAAVPAVAIAVGVAALFLACPC